ncbi:phosphotransferase [Thalassotalea crassostreae]|uniref:phosphotransferase n=1 Tax=Thalassotalea crassostreae TaxID=1763536 RepID=UPI00138FB52C|nr:phosphotransferase [Thalassotalea crassostreae]
MSNSPLLSEITQGLSHCCFRAIADKQTLFVKVFSERNASVNDHSFIEQQAMIAKLTGDCGLSPKLIDVDKEHRLLINEYVAGQSPKLTASDTEADKEADKQSTQTIKILAECAYRTHQLVLPVSAIKLQKVIQQLLRAVNLSDEQNSDILGRVNQIVDEIAIDKSNLVSCHGDINLNNILLTDHTNCHIGSNLIQLVDWEYACLAEREYEVAMCASINQLSRSQTADLVHYYQQLSSINGVATVKLDNNKVTRYLVICNIINHLWFCLYDLDNAESDSSISGFAIYKFILTTLHQS